MTLNRNVFRFLAAAVLTLSATIGHAQNTDDPTVVQNFEPARFLGLWHQIARSPNFNQRHCVRSHAEYSAMPTGEVSVFNTCYKNDGTKSTISGKAWIPDANEPAKLKVRLDGVPFTADYWVIELDPLYQWAVTSGPKKGFVYILARKAPMDPVLLQSIVSTLEGKGFETSKLIYDDYSQP